MPALKETTVRKHLDGSLSQKPCQQFFQKFRCDLRRARPTPTDTARQEPKHAHAAPNFTKIPCYKSLMKKIGHSVGPDCQPVRQRPSACVLPVIPHASRLPSEDSTF